MKPITRQDRFHVVRTMPPITTLLSQYELLARLASNLSSADIIHLAQTCKEHWEYVTSSKPLLNNFLSQARCDGSGLLARAQVFGHWRGDVSKASVECRGAYAYPCIDCGAAVCNECRFHVFYDGFDNFYYSDDDEFALDFTDFEWGMPNFEDFFRQTEERSASARWEEYGDPEPGSCIERKKARYILFNKSIVHYCVSCHPLIESDSYTDDPCVCNAYTRFVRPWRCIPCVLAEETLAVRAPHTGPLEWSHVLRRYLLKRILCPCGNDIMDCGLEICKWCGLSIGGTNSPVELLANIHNQLGGLSKSNGDDAILGQLG